MILNLFTLLFLHLNLQKIRKMELLKGISILLKRFFIGTKQCDINYKNFEIVKAERNYLRNRLYKLELEKRKLELELQTLKHQTV